jgi:disulfide bond formation protein DsbB
VQPLIRRATEPRSATLLILAAAVATIGAALFSQHVIGLVPCKLCLIQRQPYYAAIPLALAIVLLPLADGWRRLGLAALAAIFAISAGLGAYHAGVEWGLWTGPTECTGPVVDLGKAGNLLERLDSVKVIRCDEVQWRFLGLSLAGYNVLISLSMAAIAAWGIVKPARRV